MKNQSLAFLLSLGNVAIWSVNPAVLKIFSNSFPPLQLICAGMGIAVAFYLAVLAVRKEVKGLLSFPRRVIALSCAQGALLFLYYWVFLTAYKYISPQLVVPISNTWTLLFAVVSPVLLRQRISRKEIFWIAFAYMGVLLSLCGAQFSGMLHPFGLACACACPVIFMLYWLLNTWNPLSQEQNFFLCFLVSFLLSAATLLSQGDAVTLSWEGAAACLYMGFLEFSVPYFLLGMAFRLAESASRIATLELCIPFCSLIFIWLLLGESILWTTPVSLAIILFGIVMQQRAAAERVRRTARAKA